RSLCHDVRLAQGRIDLLEVGVTVGDVDDGAETRFQVDGLSCEIELEVRRRRRALHADVLEQTLEGAGGIQRTADAFDGVESRVHELVVTPQRRGAWLMRVS